ncbi:hypothetical protein GGR56DRAFT_680801 [Xylariaceae sp. FL0804]|nr:hypothetical protein GGR56DRAFT_680801 [Xylariaceae sp. FL0804]
MDTTTPTWEPIAITGLSFKMPQDAVDEDGLWRIMENGTNVKTRWPADRSTTDAFFDGITKKPNTLPTHYAHFMTEDPAAFDAPFFSITAKEAASMSPRQRQALEVAYHTFENAGIPMETLRGSRTAVYGASMADDWTLMASKDAESVPRTSITGNSPSLLPNKISWFFDLRGPSVHVDTACSSGLTAFDLACQSMLCGDADAALVFGSSTLLSPETSLHLANLNFLSPDGCCYSFDSRANGYGRGEGVVALYLKPLRSAVDDGDVVRALVRATASNQDGRTPGLTQPSVQAQAELIRHTYAKAGLELSKTRYVEAHGTGTPTGDPIEAEAIARVFGKQRSPNEPLYVGSIKANVGHLEGSSGPAGVVKAVMMLERGIIPPQALFENLNPGIDAVATNIPTEKIPWPQPGQRRISVNSFGFGGANAHVVLDDALSYMREHKMRGFYRCIDSESSDRVMDSGVNGTPRSEHHGVNGTVNGHTNGNTNGNTNAPRLLVWSAADKPALNRVLQAYTQYYSAQVAGRPAKLDQLAYTLAARRSVMAWRSFAVVVEDKDDEDDDDGGGGRNTSSKTVAEGSSASSSSTPAAPSLPREKLLRAGAERTDIAFVFTGQGAQYRGMGLALLHYPVFADSLRKSEEIFRGFGCDWSLFDVLQDENRINAPDFSQPLCTALQIALVDLLRSFAITPAAVVGHSSGEIAAAYTAAALSHESACKVAYFRGRLAGRLARQLQADGTPGAMLSANLDGREVPKYLENIGVGMGAPGQAPVCLACVNSPKNVTLAGPAHLIDLLKDDLASKGIFAQRLNTGIAYHSPAMKAVAEDYAAAMGSLQKGSGQDPTVMVSSVTGQIVEPEVLAEPQYWVDNMVSPVQFAQALEKLTAWAAAGTDTLMAKSTDNPVALADLVEVGAHSALRRPVRETVPQFRYHTCLQRSVSPLQSTLQLVGSLFCHGYPVSITTANGQGAGKHAYLVDCPAYPFDRSRRYWEESRMSKAFRLRNSSPGFLLGRRTHDWNPLRPRWRNWLSVETTPWLGEHQVTGVLVLPGTGSLVIAMEAVREVCAARNCGISGFSFRDFQLLSPLRIGQTARDAVETDVHLYPLQTPGEREATWFRFRIFTHNDGRVTETCNARVQVQYEEDATTPAGHESMLEHKRIRELHQDIRSRCSQALDTRAFYKDFAKYGFKYGPSYTVVSDASFDPVGRLSSAGKVNWDPAVHEQAGESPVHPAILDGVLQVLLATAPKGLENTSTMIPRRIGRAWVSNAVWCRATGTVHAAGTVSGTQDEGGPFMNFLALGDDGAPLCAVEDVKAAEISQAERPDDKLWSRRLLYSMAWKPRLSSLGPGQLQKICDAAAAAAGSRHDDDDDDDDEDDDESSDPSDVEVMRRAFPKFERSLRLAAREALQTLSADQRSQLPAHRRKYVDLLGRQAACLPAEEPCRGGHAEFSVSTLSRDLEECETEYRRWHLFPAVARALPSLLRGEVDPLDLIFGETRAAEMFYESVYRSHMRSGAFRAFLSLASHENPGLRILEVGAGTASFTRHILSALQALERERGGIAFAQYTFTDVSATFFSNAQAQLKEHLGRMSFREWNIEQDAADSAPELDIGSYDIIFAGSVLHATSDVSKALLNLRRLLKPGGHLVIQEITSTQVACVNIGFGSLEGWWLAKEKWRQDGPLVAQDHWDHLLRSTGFQGIDLALKDFEDESCHISTIMVSQASHGSPQAPGRPAVGEEQHRLVLVTDGSSTDQASLAGELGKNCANHQVIRLSNIVQGWKASPGDIVVSLVDVGASCLASIGESDFRSIQHLVQGARGLLWVSATTDTTLDSSLPWDPRSGVATGLLRSVRGEESDRHIITLIVNQVRTSAPQEIAAFVTQVLHSYFNEDGSAKSQEIEFVVQDGHITVGRMVHEGELEEERVSHIRPRPQTEKWKDGPPVVFEVQKPGMLDSLGFVEDPVFPDDLGADEVEIAAEAWPVSFRDVFVALGKIDNSAKLGWECAGRVTRVGAAGLGSLNPGDRVVMGAFGCMRSRPRSSIHAVQRIPDDMSLIDAVCHVNPGMTAWHGLVNLARLQTGEKVLIHSAAGATGQMAIGIAAMVGAEIFATVGSDEKRRLLVEELNIAEDHIFSSRDISFAQGIKRVTGGYGVDVVLNSLAGESLHASWDCVAPFGRFIEIGKADIMANSSLHMGGFARNVSFAAVDLVAILKTKFELARELFTTTMGLVADGRLRVPTPLHRYTLAEVEKAFRFMQSGNSTGRIVIVTETGNEYVTKQLVYRSTWRLDADATYVVVGGLGGLGRAIIQWMVSKGAKNFLVPSRSGPSTQAASDLVATLEGQAISIATPRCDASSKADFSEMLQEYTGSKPQAPIRGCINAAMVAQDAIFANMSHDQWAGAMRSKVESSWHLHTMLPRDLDFFILLSSLAGVYGAMGQSNYAAGCTFQDSLARARAESDAYPGVSVSLDLGWLLDAGIVSENEEYRRKWEGAQDIAGVQTADLIAMLDHFCDPARRLGSGGLPPAASSKRRSQLFIGAITPADLSRNGKLVPASMSHPFLDAFRFVSSRGGADTGSRGSASQMPNHRDRFLAANSSDEACNAVMQALKDRLAHALGIEMDDVDPGRPVLSYGVDSLMAVELRNWMRKDYGVDIAVFEILGGITVVALSREVTIRSAENSTST